MAETFTAAALEPSALRATRLTALRRTLKRAHLTDRIGRYIISFAGVLVLLGVGTIFVFLIDQSWPLIAHPASHSSATLSKMSLPQQYEGYPKAIYVWQTEATDGGQEKFGVPLLIWGTLKAAFWAMLFSVPLALLAALYVAEFSSPRARTIIKSSIEILAGIPTVIIGFVAFVTLSTLLNNYYVTHTDYFKNGLWIIFGFQILVFAVVCSAIFAKAALSKNRIISKLGPLSALVSGTIAAFISGWLLEKIFGLSLRPIFGVSEYTQLNAILTGFCLSFAITPIIFSVAEDALKAVPTSYREASLALGANRWETAFHTVLPAAIPGVYAAVILGLARAVGETMIVLMASGNTPIFDFSPFTGMRTMSATIAIEASEKAQFSTGYHVLFFVGCLLFLMTFVLNLVTEHAVHRLKQRYKVV